jgi:acetyltransferase-like isoleucine patch superfamily enzyme
MNGFLRIFSRLLRKYRAALQRKAMLERLRVANPNCTLMSADIYETQLGSNNAVLDHTTLRRVNMGKFSYVSNDSCLINAEVGSFCSIGPHVKIGLAPHPTSIFVSTYPAFYSNFNEGCPQCFREDKIFDDSVPKTRIGHDVWIGSSAIIPGGIQIGTGAIVASGSVVVKDIPPYAVVGGNPAKIIRLRFSEAQIEILLKSEWWNWPADKILQNVDAFSDIQKFSAIVD